MVRGPEHPRDRLTPAERRLVEALLIRKPLSSELLAARAGVPAGEAMRILPSLVLRAFARRREHGFVLASAEPGPDGPAPPGAAA